MEDEKMLRKQLVNLLTENQAHMGFDEMIKDFPMDKINTVFPNGEYTSWGLLEHIRRTQNDIWEFIVSDNYQEKEWPADYWPEPGKKATEKEWEETIKLFNEDREKLVKIVIDPKTDLFTKIKNGTGQNILREILVVADHNAYHIGEFAIMRQVMKTWKK